MMATMSCPDCEMLSINGIPCHEIGCPNSRSRWDADSGEWIRQRKCWECGCTVDVDDPCCQSDEEPMEDQKMTRDQALPYVGHYLDDALSDQHSAADLRDDARLVGWQCGFEPMFVAVQSYIPGVRLDDWEAEEIASDYLAEIGWFSGEPTPADYII